MLIELLDQTNDEKLKDISLIYHLAHQGRKSSTSKGFENSSNVSVNRRRIHVHDNVYFHL